jgi:hypothetical protein
LIKVPSIDKGAIDRTWEERRRVRSLAEVLVPSSKYFGVAGLDSEQVAYKRQHLVDASRTRGRVHGFEFVRQCWQALLDGGVDERCIAKEIIRPWIESVSEWVATEISPDRLDTPRQFSLESDLPRLEETLVQFPGTRLVVIDPVAAYCGKVDSHKKGEVRGMLAPLAEMASRHGRRAKCDRGRSPTD